MLFLSLVFFLSVILIKIINSLEEEKPNYLKFKFNTKLNPLLQNKLNSIYNETNFLKDYLNNIILLDLSMGNPKQNIKIILEPNDICFSFTQNNELLNLELEHKINNYTQIIPYNKKISKSAKNGERIHFTEIKNGNNDLYNIEEIFYLYQYSDIKNKNNNIINSETYLNFLYENIRNEKENENIYGKIGLNINNYKDVNCPRFIPSLKKKNIIKKYVWYFEFYSRFGGNFYIGPEPHLYNIKYNIFKDYQYIKLKTILSNEGYVQWNILFDKILLKNNANNYRLYLNDKMAKIEFNLGLIIGTNEYQKIIENNFFKYLIKKKICKKSLEKIFVNNIEKSYYVYKCNEASLLRVNLNNYFSYYDSFPQFEFFSADLEYSLELSNYDLFEKINGYMYFLIIFDSENNSVWKLGQVFLKKHVMIFDHESKTIGFYNKELKPKEEDIKINDNLINNEFDSKNIINNITEINNYKNNKNTDNIINNNSYEKLTKKKKILNNIIKCFILIIIISIIIIISFCLGMKIKESRKKRANELKDDDFEYLPNNNINISTNQKYNQKIELNKMGV